GAAAGLVGSNDHGDEFRAEQRTGKKQRLQLRIRARRRENDVGDRWRQTKEEPQLVAQLLDALVEGGIDPDIDRRSHQAFARGLRPVKGALRNRGRGARGKAQRFRARRWLTTVFV